MSVVQWQLVGFYFLIYMFGCLPFELLVICRYCICKTCVWFVDYTLVCWRYLVSQRKLYTCVSCLFILVIQFEVNNKSRDCQVLNTFTLMNQNARPRWYIQWSLSWLPMLFFTITCIEYVYVSLFTIFAVSSYTHVMVSQEQHQ